MAVAGLRGTGDWGTDERPKNFREMILWRDPNGQAPMTALMARMKTDATDDPEFSWWEEELKPVRLLTDSVHTTGETTIDIDDGDAQDLVAGDLLLVESTETAAASYGFEIIEVSSITSSTQFDVTRGAANTTAGTISDNTYLLKIGNAFEEGSSAPDSSTRNPSKYTNLCQIFKHTYRITNTAKQTRTRTGDPIQNDKKRKMFDHSVSLEEAFLWGHKYETTGSAGKPRRFTGGLWYWLTQNYSATATHQTIKVWTTTAVDEDDILDEFHTVFDYNAEGAGNERIVLAGNGFLNYLNKIANSSSSTRINYNGTIDVFGMKLQRWTTPQGTFYIRSHPLMNVNTRFTNGAFIINPAGIRYRPLRGRDTKFQDNIQSPGDDETKGQWLTEAGAEFHHLKTMKYVAIQV